MCNIVTPRKPFEDYFPNVCRAHYTCCMWCYAEVQIDIQSAGPVMSNVSPTLGINEQIHALRATGRNVVHLGFGQSPFPPPGRIIETLRDNAGESAYLPVAGLPELRSAVAAHQQRLTGIDAEDFHVLVAPGSKLILFAAQMAIEGDLLLPRPSWVSYAPQAYMLKQRVAWVPTQLHDHSYLINESDLSKNTARGTQAWIETHQTVD